MQKVKIKCRDYNVCNSSCLECDLLHNIKCNKIFDFGIPKKFIKVERRDCYNIGWNECPSWGDSIGYRPDIKDFKCKRCGQRILWR